MFYFEALAAALVPAWGLGFVWADVASDSRSVPRSLTSLSQSDLKAINSSKKLSKSKQDSMISKKALNLMKRVRFEVESIDCE